MRELTTYHKSERYFRGECNGLEIEIRPECFRPENPRWFVEISYSRSTCYWDGYWGTVKDNPIQEAIDFARKMVGDE